MKKNHLKLVTLLCGICLLIFACRKDLKSLLGDQPAPESAVLTSAKSWQLNEVRKFPAKLKKTTLLPRWNQAWTMKTSDGKSIMVVPTKEVNLTDKSFSMRRFYIFDLDGNNITSGKIVELLGDKNYDVSDHLAELLPNLKSKSIPGFNGAIIQYTINYRRWGGVAFENGVRTDKAVTLLQGKSMKSGQSTYSNANVGERPIKVNDKWVFGTYVRDECFYRVTYNSFGDLVACDFVSCPETETTTSASASATDPGTTYGGIQLQEVIINAPAPPKRKFNMALILLDHKCFGRVITHLMDINAYYQVITKPFTEQSGYVNPPTINMSTDNNMAWPDANGNGRATLGDQHYNTVTHVSDIKFNEKMLSNSSRLLIYSAIIHETLHAYIRLEVNFANDQLPETADPYGDMDSWATLYGTPAGFTDHNAMLTYFMESTVGLLKEMDSYVPNANPALREAEEKKYYLAALYGLKEQATTPQEEFELLARYNNFMSAHNITRLEAENWYRDNVNMTDASKRLPNDQENGGCPK